MPWPYRNKSWGYPGSTSASLKSQYLLPAGVIQNTKRECTKSHIRWKVLNGRGCMVETWYHRDLCSITEIAQTMLCVAWKQSSPQTNAQNETWNLSICINIKTITISLSTTHSLLNIFQVSSLKMKTAVSIWSWSWRNAGEVLRRCQTFLLSSLRVLQVT